MTPAATFYQAYSLYPIKYKFYPNCIKPYLLTETNMIFHIHNMGGRKESYAVTFPMV